MVSIKRKMNRMTTRQAKRELKDQIERFRRLDTYKPGLSMEERKLWYLLINVYDVINRLSKKV